MYPKDVLFALLCLKKPVDQHSSSNALPTDSAVNRLLNLVESLCKDIEGLKGEADRLRKLLEEKKRNKQLFSTKTGYDDLDKRIAATGAKSELLTVLHYPECPMHNNTSELGARVSARRRDVSLHSRGAKGAHAMDVFTTIVQTCKKLGTSSYQFFRQFLTCEKSALDIPQTIRITANQQIPALC